MKDAPGYDVLSGWLALPKRATFSSGWDAVDRRPLAIGIAAPLVVSSAPVEGLLLIGSAVSSLPDRKVTLTVTAEFSGRARPIARVDWRDAAHDNTSLHCGPHRFLPAGRSHVHIPSLHTHLPDPAVMFSENLPVAMPLKPEPENYSELLAACARILGIQNLQDMPVPKWQNQTSFL